ncbi:Phosphoserine aminotransferase, partial [Cichlidogyrus casuarinus]
MPAFTEVEKETSLPATKTYSPTRESIDEMLKRPESVITFAAGPTKLPRSVKEQVIHDILDLDDTGIGILEFSHRSKKFTKIMNDATAKLRSMLKIPLNYHILYLQGGATGQFSGIPMNLFGKSKNNPPRADYLVTGTWSAKAFKEAQPYGEIREICARVKNYNALPDPKTFQFDPQADYFLFCDNETVHGLEYNEDTMPQPPEGVPIVCDMSSNFLSRPIDVSKYGIIFAGAQKNLGAPGVTIVIVRDDLLDQNMPTCPGILNYKHQVNADSLYNTGPTFKYVVRLALIPHSIYLTLEICKWAETLGNMDQIDALCKQRSKAVYDVIDNSSGFYRGHVEVVSHRSRVNVVLKCPTEELDQKWQNEARDRGLVNLNGHRSIGGLRISMYNAMTLEE